MIDGDAGEPEMPVDLPLVRLMTTLSPAADLLMLEVTRSQARTLRDRARSSLDGDEAYTGVRFSLSDAALGAVVDGLTQLEENQAADTARVDLSGEESAVLAVLVSLDPDATAAVREDLQGYAGPADGEGDWVVTTAENAVRFFLVQLEAALEGAEDPLQAAADQLDLEYPG